jgi:hypothetical protein
MTTIEEIDEALRRLPASPETSADVEARANLMQRRFDVQAATRNAAVESAAAAKNRQWGLPLVNVPGDLNCIVTGSGRNVIVDIVDGRRVAQLTRDEVIQLSVTNDAWLNLNPGLAR